MIKSVGYNVIQLKFYFSLC